MRIIIIYRRWAAVALCLCTSAAIFWVVAHPSNVITGAEQRSLPIYSVEVGSEKCISMTFDAAWDDVRMRQFRKVTELPHFFIYPLHFLIRCSSSSLTGITALVFFLPADADLVVNRNRIVQAWTKLNRSFGALD